MSLKDALLKAGFNSTKKENDRKPKRKKELTKTEKHQQHRNFCEVCECIHPDVERFRHRMPTVDAEWICVNCADKNEILDQFRVTNQSDFARSNRYQRFYGPTKDFSKEGLPERKPNNRGPKNRTDRNRADGNRSGNRDRNFNKKRSPNNRQDRDGNKNFNR